MHCVGVTQGTINKEVQRRQNYFHTVPFCHADVSSLYQGQGLCYRDRPRDQLGYWESGHGRHFVSSRSDSI